MDLLMTILLLMGCLLISNIISHYVPSIPTALTQIVLGVIIAFAFKHTSFELEEEWFFLLFVAPILYNDGKYFPREELWKMRRSIFGNSLILVLLTTIGGGYFIHWMIPGIPLAAAFALAAILSPTDPVAVNGIAKRIHIPEKVLNLVKGESLINDASGIVAFNYAIAAVVTGYFSLKDAILNFSYLFLAGAVLGVIFALILTLIRFNLRKEGINDVVFHSLLQILAPFVIFIITEEFLHASGVIAVVVAGIVHSLISRRFETSIAEEQVLTENIWSIILFVLNGIVFLLLGLNIPLSMSETIADPNIGNLKAIGYVIAIGFVILAIRFIWSYISAFYEYRLSKSKNIEVPNVKIALLTSLTGVRGTVTMAGVLSIPFFLDNGDTFPERSLILFLTAGVILFTLICATIFLPFLCKGELEEDKQIGDKNLIEAKNKLLFAGIKAVESEINDENESVAYELIHEYKHISQNLRFEQTSSAVEKNFNHQEMVEIQLIALKAERKYINELMGKSEIDEQVFKALDKSLDYREEVFLRNPSQDTMFLVRKLTRATKIFYKKFRKRKEIKLNNLKLVKDIQLKSFQAAIEALEEYLRSHEGSNAAQDVILYYRTMINRFKGNVVKYNEESIKQKEELRIKAMDIERSAVRNMYESGEITREESNELRRYINYIESVILYKHAE
ncbi:Na+/H+ antiporter [Clostridium beijerinckii]|uniref:CPA1 family monovalent cation:H+ antiporter n=2 Tax=Clostridium beijerinckii TaxID=1520 RepID=A0A9Q5CW72_CLOBE|nr:Na+/H+ antiporter [Clostridium beijerinckii]AQS05460.1 sodium, potassium, lithium and rubidium/H(+) antiporter [Clostridium beijerinckii]MBA2885039.1 CPA1 family monovalent cation:H+ antiporter [Clostridium beijerinckii]MBA2899587.1 CPA1 family monovalent cation:H+ antiporter [Clostridium beijerinckii]MBA2909390.1 CPA1 family monovalent cation:H+ antiporter [Clostridium beijerinckii]MBA9014963.1 CPA1 family monovalent cation:H+ antiporter [Clostridium beijerinckii]